MGSAWWDWILFWWLANYSPSVLLMLLVGSLTCKTVSRMTYTVLVETLNPTHFPSVVLEVAVCCLGRINKYLSLIADVMFPGIRNALMESPDHQCPSCETPGQSPDVLIPNKYLRAMVTSFINETGYISTKKSASAAPPETASSNSNMARSASPARTVVLKSESLDYELPPPPLPPHLVGEPPSVTRMERVKPEFHTRQSQHAAVASETQSLSVPIRPSAAGGQYGYQSSRSMGYGPPAMTHKPSHHLSDVYSQALAPAVTAGNVVQSQSAPSLLSHSLPE